MRVYTVSFDNVAIAAAQDLFEISPADDKPVRFLGFTLSNVAGTADAGDAQEELLRLSVIRGFTSSGSSGTAFTPVLVDDTDAAAAFAAEINNTTLATTGTTKTLLADGWNIRIPYQLWFPDERLAPRASQANTTMVVRLVTAPADSVSCSGTLWIAEY